MISTVRVTVKLALGNNAALRKQFSKPQREESPQAELASDVKIGDVAVHRVNYTGGIGGKADVLTNANPILSDTINVSHTKEPLKAKNYLAKLGSSMIGAAMVSPVSWGFGDAFNRNALGKPILVSNYSNPNYVFKGVQPPLPGRPGGLALEALKNTFISAPAVMIGDMVGDAMDSKLAKIATIGSIGAVVNTPLDMTPRADKAAVFAAHASRYTALFGTSEVIDGLYQAVTQEECPKKNLLYDGITFFAAAFVAKPFYTFLALSKEGNNPVQSWKRIAKEGVGGFTKGMAFRVPSAGSVALGVGGIGNALYPTMEEVVGTNLPETSRKIAEAQKSFPASVENDIRDIARRVPNGNLPEKAEFLFNLTKGQKTGLIIKRS